MNLEIDYLSRLAIHIEESKIANQKLQNERERIIADTVDTKLYCSTVGITRQTLARRRDAGTIPFVILGTEYRYFLPKKGLNNG
jgi:hypothetical protein